MKTLHQIIKNLTEEQKQLLADTIVYGSWGDAEVNFSDGDAYGSGYITNDAYKGGHFERKTLSIKFQELYKALNMIGDKYEKKNIEMAWFHNWWGDGSGSVLFIRCDNGLDSDFWRWAKNYK